MCHELYIFLKPEPIYFHVATGAQCVPKGDVTLVPSKPIKTLPGLAS